MDEVTKLLHSPVFWLCTGLGSVVFNVLSHYVIRFLERFAALVGLGSSRFLRRRRKKFLQRVAQLNRFVVTHPNGVPLYLHRSDSARFHALGALIVSALLGAVSIALHYDTQRGPISPDVAAWLSMAYLLIATGYANRGIQLERLFRRSKYFYRGDPFGI